MSDRQIGWTYCITSYFFNWILLRFIIPDCWDMPHALKVMCWVASPLTIIPLGICVVVYWTFTFGSLIIPDTIHLSAEKP